MPLDRALTLAADSTDIRRFRSAAREVARQLESGQSAVISGSEAAGGGRTGLPPLVRLALARSDDKPLFVGSLRQAASIYHYRAVRHAEWYAEVLPIVLTAVIGGTLTIGFTLLVIAPYATMLHELSKWFPH